MSRSAKRVFTEQFLAEVGVPTIDMFGRALTAGDLAGAGHLLDRQEQELLAMYYNYRGWEKGILREFVALGGEQQQQRVLAMIEDRAIAPERLIETTGIVERWKASLSEIRDLMDKGDAAAANALGKALLAEGLEVHDSKMSRVTALLSELYREYGDETLQRVLQTVMDPSAMDPDGRLPFKEKVEKIIFFTRVHLLPFKLIEDDEKVTFMPDPCPSGARLIRQGHYDTPRNGARLASAGPLTYGEKDFPIYCCHEPAMELSSVIQTGVPVFIVEPSQKLGVTPCKIYVYKDPAAIPAPYFERLGLAKPTDLIARS